MQDGSPQRKAVDLDDFIYLFIYLFYFIILPHTMNYKQNKNDNK